MTTSKQAGTPEQPSNPFDDAAAEVSKGLDSAHKEAIAVLLTFGDSVERKVFNSQPNVEVLVVPGLTVNMGQQYKFVIHIKDDRDSEFVSFKDTLFRVYIPADGYPVVVDLFGKERPSCDDKASLEAALVRLLRDEDFKLRLQGLKTLAEDQAGVRSKG
jgi:hypothetical protein